MRKEIKGLFPMDLQFFADGEAAEGANETEAADQSEGAVSTSEETGDEGVKEEAAEPQPQAQSPETNAAFAEMRRRMEAAEKKAADVDRMYAQQFGNLKNPETGQPIRSAQDYFDALAAQERMNARKELQEKNIDPELIDKMIANSPVIRQAEAATKELNQMKAKNQLEMDMNQILLLDPSLTSVDDIYKDPALPQMIEKVQQGMSLVDAYKIVNFDRVSSAKTAAAKQAVVNQVKGQAHLSNATGVSVNDSLEDIPASMVETFKEQFPGKTMKELKALYNMTLQSRR